MESTEDALPESNMGLEFNTMNRCEGVHATPRVGKDEDMIESSATDNRSNGFIESNTGLEPDSTDCGVVVDATPRVGGNEEMIESSAGALIVESHVGGNDEMVKNFPGKDSVDSKGGSIPKPSDVEEAEDEYAKTLRFNDLCQRAIKFAEDGAASIHTYRVALRALEKALEEVAIAKKNGVIIDQFGTPVSGIQVNNSANQLILKSEKRTRKCKICKEDGHYKRTCPVWRSSSDAEDFTPTDNSKGNLDLPGSQASLQKISENSLSDNDEDGAPDNKKNVVEFVAPTKSIDKVRLKSSNYHGVTRHRSSGRYETHLWDNGCRGDGQKVKGKLVYLGGYDDEEKAARAYDLAALKFWGPSRKIKLNYPISDYEKELKEMKDKTREEFVMSIRRKSDRFTRGSSIYKGVTRRQSDGKWQARIGPCNGNKDFYYLGTYSTEREAAEAYDVACIELRGLKAVTNFDISTYCEGGWKELEEFCRQKVVMSKWKQNYDESRVPKKL